MKYRRKRNEESEDKNMKNENIKTIVKAMNLQMMMDDPNFYVVEKVLEALGDETGYEFRIVNRRVMYKEHGMLHDAYANL